MAIDEAYQILNVRDVRIGNDTAMAQMLKVRYTSEPA